MCSFDFLSCVHLELVCNLGYDQSGFSFFFIHRGAGMQFLGGVKLDGGPF